MSAQQPLPTDRCRPWRAWIIAVVTALCVAVAIAPASAKSKRPAKPSATTHYAEIIVEAESGTPIYAVGADEGRYPASLTKMMTLLLLFEAVDHGRLTMDTALRVSGEAASQPPTKLGLDAGETIRVRDVILALITKSANDAAVVAAEGLAGSEDRFAQQMTQRAHQLGMHNTFFYNASGLPDNRQVTTARDLATLARVLIRNYPHHYGNFAVESFTYAGVVHRNHNHLMEWYEGVDGLKTGYTRASGYNLAASAERDGKRLIAVVLGGRSGPGRDREMARLLNLGFERVGDGTPLRSASFVAPAPERRVVAEPEPQRTAAVAAAPAGGRKSIVIDHAKKPTVAAATTKARAEPPAAKGRAKTVQRPSWGVQVGVFSKREDARRVAAQAAKRAPKALSHASIQVAPTELRTGTAYRAQLVGLNQQQASQACDLLERHRQPCLTLSPNAIVSSAMGDK